MTTDKLILYTNHRCPWAQRAHIALAELGIPYDEVFIDLDRPRDASYLEINPRGLVPALKWNGEIIIESGIVAQFLVDQYPSHLVPATSEEGGALRRARIGLFVDAFINKFNVNTFKLLGATPDEAGSVVETAIAALVKEVEPLLQDAKQFFGGSERLTLAEVLTGSFVIRFFTIAKGGVYPVEGVLEEIKGKAPKFYAWAEKVIAHPSVNGLFDAQEIVAKSKIQREKLLAAKL